MVSQIQFLSLNSLKKYPIQNFKNFENFKVLEVPSLRYLQSALHLDLSRCQGRESSSTVELMSGRQLMISRGQFQNNLLNLIQGKDRPNLGSNRGHSSSLNRTKTSKVNQFLVKDL